MNISLAQPTLTPYGYNLEEYAPSTVFVVSDSGRWYINPVLHDQDEDCVVFEDCGEDWSRGEMMGRAVALAFLTPQEAVEIARQHRLHLTYNNRYFCYSAPTRKRISQWCAGFRKQRGTRTHLIPATVEQSVKLIEGRLKISYTTYSNRCQFVVA